MDWSLDKNDKRYKLCNSREPVDREAANTTKSDVMSILNPVHSEFRRHGRMYHCNPSPR